MPYQARPPAGWSPFGKRSATLRLMRRLSTTESIDHHEEEAEQQQAGVVLHDEAREDRADQRDGGDRQEEAADVAPRVDDVAHELAHRAAVAGGQVGVVAAGGTLTRARSGRRPAVWRIRL